MRQQLLLAAAFIGCLAYTCTGQVIPAERLDSLMDILETEQQAMGSLAISKNGEVLYQKAIGYAYIDGNEKFHARETTKYRIGSVSKMFTAVIIFQLVEENKLSLEHTLDQFFPTIPNAEKITIAHLLNHHSGIHNFTNDMLYMSYHTMPKTMDEMVAIIAAAGSDFTPSVDGTTGAYSNSNYVLLGYIIEKVTGHSFHDNIHKRITSKAKLHHTYVGGPIDPSNNEAYSYQRVEQWHPFTETDMSIPGGAGAVVSTPADLTIFIDALFTGKLVSEASLQQMKTMTDGYGMGIFRIPFYERFGYGHNGSIDAFFATLGYFPDDSLAVAYCTNGQVYPMNDILIGVLSILYEHEYTLPSFKTIELEESILQQYVGLYASDHFPLKLSITRDGKALFAQATGQMAIPLDATAVDRFKFDAAGILIEFNRDTEELVLQQGGGKYTFKKE